MSNDEYLIRLKLSLYNHRIQAIETIFGHRIELQPFKRKEIRQYIDKEKAEYQNKIKQLEKELEILLHK